MTDAPPLRPIAAVAAELGLTSADLIPYGHDKAKIRLDVLQRPRHRPEPAKLVLVSALTPTPAGEGKTTTTIGLGQALGRLGHRVVLALREPSLGPVMGSKGGATGGGAARIEPSASINLHFTGDFHAITAAHNLLAAAVDSHLHHGNELRIDPRRLLWRRVLDVNDRALRQTLVGLSPTSGASNGPVREDGFDITAASEIMAILCLATGVDDLRARLGRILIAFDVAGGPVYAASLGITGALLALLLDALQPNLVQTVEGQPVLVHGGPFANIAHGCNSLLATKMALHLGDIVVTEAGFAFDLGAEKFFDIKARLGQLPVHAVVLVVTARALAMHGGVAKAALQGADVAAIERGLPNLDAHLDACAGFGVRPVVAVNRFGGDDPAALQSIVDHCARRGVVAAISDHYATGGAGAEPLARALTAVLAEASGRFEPCYPLEASVESKIAAVATRVYGADRVELSAAARKDIAAIEALGLGSLPICIAKTQNSLSDDANLRGRPRGFALRVARILPNVGAGFLVVITGDILRMPGLSKVPACTRIDVVDGAIVGVG